MAEDLLYYVDRKSKLDSALKEGVPFAPTYSGHVGLINQGSTLYLNSLIQCLFYNVPFRTLVLLQNSESPVLKAIQEIFCYLQLSESCAVSTKELVSAFGWSHGQVFEQHDAHELFGLLLDSLGDEDPLLGANLSKMFRGSMTDTLSCPSCLKKQETRSSFLNISLELDHFCSTGVSRGNDSVDVPPVRKTAPQHLDLKILLELHMQTEILDEWECLNCSSNVEGIKYNEYTSLPPNLMIHLQRLKYNSGMSKREKLTTPVYFPCLLDVSSLKRVVTDENYIACHGKSSSAVGDVRESAFSMAGNTYRLHSILLHTGTANGGHYKAYVLDSGTGRWLECNGASVCELSSREEASLFLQASTVYTVHTEPESSDDAKVTEGNEKNSVLRSRSRESMKKFVTLRDDVLRENAYMFLYQKVSDDVVAKSLQNNDIAQGIYSEEEKNESNKLMEKCISAVPTSLAKKILEENADLQELRRLNEIHKKIIALKILFKRPTVNTSSKVTAAKCSKYIGNSRDELQVVYQIVLSCETLNEIIRKVCPLLSLPLPSSSSSKSSVLTSESTSASASAIASGPAISQGQEQEEKGSDKQNNKSLIKGNSISTQYYRLREFSEISRRKGATYGSRGDEPIASLGFSLLNTSITSHSPVVLLLEERTEDDPPFEEEIDQIMILRALVWSEELSGAMETTLDFLETLCCYFPSSNPHTDMDMDMDMDVEVDLNTDHTNTMSLIRNTMMEILVPGEVTATLGALREAVAIQINRSISEITLLVSSQSGDLIMECDQDHRSLGKAYGIKPGDLIFVEIGVPLTSPPSPSSNSPDSLTLDSMAPCIPESIALSALNRRLTSIVIYFNDPRDPTSSTVPQTDAVLPDQMITDSKARCADQNFLKVSPQTLLSDFKTLLSKKLNIDLKKDDFYMSRNDSFSPSQLKDVSLSLHDASLRNLGSVYLQIGQGCAVGEHFLYFDFKSEVSYPVVSNEGSIVSKSSTASQAPSSSEKAKCSRKVIVHELMTVLQLKQQLLDDWDTVLSSGDKCSLPLKPMSPNHIRLRDLKIPGSSGLGTLLRNERVLARCISGISDGRKISLMVLREAEIIDPLDWILSVKIITYSTPVISAAGSQVQDAVSGCTTEGDDGEYSEGCMRDYTVKKVYRAVDLPVNRSATLRQLYQAILSAFPHLREIPIAPLVKPLGALTTPPTSANQIISEQIQVVKDESVSEEFIEKSLLSIAKGFSSGAPLSLSMSVKSAWDPLALTSSPDLKIDHPSFGFRDGVVLLVRGAADWQRALSQDSSLSQGSEGDGAPKAAPTRPVMKPLGSFKSKSSGGVRMARGDRALSVGDVRISTEEPSPLSDTSRLQIDSTPTSNHEFKCCDASGADIGTGVLPALGSMSLKPDSTMSLKPDSTMSLKPDSTMSLKLDSTMSLIPDSTLVENSTPVAKLLKSSSVPLLLPSVAQQLNDALGPT